MKRTNDTNVPTILPSTMLVQINSNNMRIYLLLTFLILSLLFILVLQQRSQYKGKNVKGAITNVYSFKLALQWPNAYCNTGHKIPRQHCELPIPQQFKIHGFWPMDKNGYVLQNEIQHGSNDLQKVDVADIQEELDEMWPDLRHQKQNFYFWAEEWRKHGNEIGYTPNSYFKLALQCKRKLDEKIGGDLVEYLSEKGFEPHATADYWNQQFPMKIHKKTGFHAEIKCNTANENSQLFEIYICFTSTGGFKSCNYLVNEKGKISYHAHDCNHRIIFPVEQETPSRHDKDEL